VVTLPANDDHLPGEPAPGTEPVLRVVRGDATPEEIAALVAVLMSRSGDESAAPGARGPARSVLGSWSGRSRQLRRPIHPSPGAWRRSGLPG
jgi:hypothetical protein